jgi:transcriptional regulator with XRE-family HTH domain
MRSSIDVVIVDMAGIGRRLREARERRGYGSAELDIMSEVGRGTTSRIESARSPEISLMVVAKVATALGVRLDWLVFGRGEMYSTHDKPALPDPPIGGFMLQIARLPGLQRWIEQNPGEFPLSTIAKGLEQYAHRPNRSREDGEPLGGWGAYFADVDAAEARPLSNSGAKAEKLIERQLGKRPRLKK